MSYIKKTTRKNKIGQTLNFSDKIFTIDDLQALNPGYCNITLRVHLKEALKKGEVIELGYLKGSKGRPKLVMAVAPITPENLKEAEEREIILKNDLIINISSVNNNIQIQQKPEEKKTSVVTREEIKERLEKILS